MTSPDSFDTYRDWASAYGAQAQQRWPLESNGCRDGIAYTCDLGEDGSMIYLALAPTSGADNSWQMDATIEWNGTVSDVIATLFLNQITKMVHIVKPLVRCHGRNGSIGGMRMMRRAIWLSALEDVLLERMCGPEWHAVELGLNVKSALRAARRRVRRGLPQLPTDVADLVAGLAMGYAANAANTANSEKFGQVLQRCQRVCMRPGGYDPWGEVMVVREQEEDERSRFARMLGL